MKAQETEIGVGSNLETMDLKQAAHYLRLGQNSTRELWERGELAGTSLNQKHLVFRRAALDAFLAAKEAEQTRERAKTWQSAHRAPTGRADKKLRRTPTPDLKKYEQRPE